MDDGIPSWPRRTGISNHRHIPLPPALILNHIPSHCVGSRDPNAISSRVLRGASMAVRVGQTNANKQKSAGGLPVPREVEPCASFRVTLSGISALFLIRGGSGTRKLTIHQQGQIRLPTAGIRPSFDLTMRDGAPVGLPHLVITPRPQVCPNVNAVKILARS